MTERETLSYLRTYGRRVEENELRMQKIEDNIKYDQRIGLILKGPIFYSQNILPVENHKSDIGGVNNFINNIYLSGKIIYPDALDFGVNNDFCIDKMGRIGFHTKNNLDGVTIKGLPAFSIQNATYLGENTLFFQINDGSMRDFVNQQDLLIINSLPYQVLEVQRDKVVIESLDGSRCHMEMDCKYDMMVYNNLFGIKTAKDEQIIRMNGFGDIFYKMNERKAEININGSVHLDKSAFVRDLNVETIFVRNNEAPLVPNLNAEFLCGKKGPLNGEIVSTKDKQQLWSKSFGDELVMHYNRILDLADPLYDMDAANKRYVDRYLSGIRVSTSVACASVEPLDADYEREKMTLHLRSVYDLESNMMISAFDDYELKVNERVLLMNQVDGWQNGVYLVVSDGIESGRILLQREVDFCERKTPEDLKAYYIFVRNGKKYGNTGMVFEYNEDFVWNESNIIFNIFSRTESYNVGSGIKKIGNNFELNYDENMFEIGENKLKLRERKIGNELLENNSINLVAEGGIDLERSNINLGENTRIGLKVSRKQFQFGKNGELELANVRDESNFKLGPDVTATGNFYNVYQLTPPEKFGVEMQYSEDFFELERDMVVQYYICSLNGEGRETDMRKSSEIYFTDGAKSIFSNIEWDIVNGCEGYVIYRRINSSYHKVKLTSNETTLLDVLVPRNFTKVDWIACDKPDEENRTTFVVNKLSTNGDNYITGGSLGIGTVQPRGVLHLRVNEVNSDGLGMIIEGDERKGNLLHLVKKGMNGSVRVVGESGDGKSLIEMGKNIKLISDDEGVVYLGRDDGIDDKNINERVGSDSFSVQAPDGSIYCGGEMMIGDGKAYSTFNSRLGNNAAIMRTGCVSSSIGNQVGFIWEGEELKAVPFNDGNILTRKKVHVKNFTIDHPEDKDRYLVHACLEGPTADVYYRGKGEIPVNREYVDINLPSYYDSLVEEGSSTLMLTPVGRPFFSLGGEIIGNKVRVFLGERLSVTVKFFWEVKGVRRDTRFEVEPKKTDVRVNKWGPYTYIE